MEAADGVQAGLAKLLGAFSFQDADSSGSVSFKGFKVDETAGLSDALAKRVGGRAEFFDPAGDGTIKYKILQTSCSKKTTVVQVLLTAEEQGDSLIRSGRGYRPTA